MGYRKIAAWIVVLAVTFSYFYTPVPNGMDTRDKWLVRKLYALTRLGLLASKVGSAVGYDTPTNIMKKIRRLRLNLVDENDFGMITERHLLDGIPVRIHTKSSWEAHKDQKRPAIFYIHGGSWRYEFPQLYEKVERRLGSELNVIVVTVDYSLVPENPFPKAFDQCLTALQYLHKQADRFGIDPTRISIGGDSAGGNLASAVVLKLRDTDNLFIKNQILIQPALQFASFRLKSHYENDFGVLTRRDTADAWLGYMNASIEFLDKVLANEHVPESLTKHPAWKYLEKYQDVRQSQIRADGRITEKFRDHLENPYFSPFFAYTLKGLPPTLIVVSDFDVIRDEALAHAERMMDDGVDVTVAQNKGFHGAYLFFSNSNAGNVIIDQIYSFLKTRL